jgi:hypothetical protein
VRRTLSSSQRRAMSCLLIHLPCGPFPRWLPVGSRDHRHGVDPTPTVAMWSWAGYFFFVIFSFLLFRRPDSLVSCLQTSLMLYSINRGKWLTFAGLSARKLSDCPGVRSGLSAMLRSDHALRRNNDGNNPTTDRLYKRRRYKP